MSHPGSSLSNTLTFMASVGMVSLSLASAQRAMPGSGVPAAASVDGVHCGFNSAVWGMDAAGSATSTPAGSLLLPASGPCSNKQLAAELCFDDASPLSSSSRVQLLGAGSLTPSSVESCGRLVLPDPTTTNSTQQQQLARLLAVQRQQQDPQKQFLQLPQQQQQQQQQLQPAGVLGASAGTTVKQAGTAQWTWQQPQALLLQQPAQGHLVALLPQSSGSLTSSNSVSSSTCISMVPGAAASSSATSTAAATTTAWQQLLQHQQLQLVQQQQQPGRQTMQIIAAARPLRDSSSSGGGATTLLVKRLAPSSSSSSYQQPAAKKAATQAAMAAMLQASNPAAAWRVAAPQQLSLVQQQPAQQQLFLVPAATARPAAAQAWNNRLPPTGLIRQRQRQQQQQQPAANFGATAALALVSAPSATAAAAAAGLAAASAPMRVLESAQQKLLHWAGRVLNCQLQDAYLLCCHLYRRVSGQLDDMLLISLGVTASTESVTMLISLWVASKLEGHRRQVAGASKLAAALQLLPASITDIELHVMQRLQWQPYAGWAARALVD